MKLIISILYYFWRVKGGKGDVQKAKNKATGAEEETGKSIKVKASVGDMHDNYKLGTGRVLSFSVEREIPDSPINELKQLARRSLQNNFVKQQVSPEQYNASRKQFPKVEFQGNIIGTLPKEEYNRSKGVDSSGAKRSSDGCQQPLSKKSKTMSGVEDHGKGNHHNLIEDSSLLCCILFNSSYYFFFSFLHATFVKRGNESQQLEWQQERSLGWDTL